MCKMTRETATVQMLTNRCSNDKSIENGRNDALCQPSGAPKENIVQNHLNIALLNVF